MLSKRLRSEVVREVLRISHKIIPKFRRFFRYRDLILYIPEGVFNPVYTLSTDLIIDTLSSKFRPKGIFLEVGCGSGVITIYVAKHLISNVKEVYACDISSKALLTTKFNAEVNEVINRIKVSNCYELLPKLRGQVDFAVANPPYLPINPKDDLDINWCGGASLGIFKEVINELINSLRPGGEGLITASSLTNLNYVIKLLRSRELSTEVVNDVRTPFDTIYLIHIVKNT